jgi:hypothetical protein
MDDGVEGHNDVAGGGVLAVGPGLRVPHGLHLRAVEQVGTAPLPQLAHHLVGPRATLHVAAAVRGDGEDVVQVHAELGEHRLHPQLEGVGHLLGRVRHLRAGLEQAEPEEVRLEAHAVVHEAHADAC